MPIRKRRIAPVLESLTEHHTGDEDLLAALEQLRLAVEQEAGADAWEQVMAAALRNKSVGLRADLREAIEAARTGAPIALKGVLRRCRADWRAWAAVRLESGAPLRPIDAVDLGLFPTTTAATTALVTWWAEQRYAVGLPTDRGALAESGIVDHLGASAAARIQAAEDLLYWLRRSIDSAVPVAA